MENPTPRRIRHNFTTYNTDITHLIPTIVDLQSVRKTQRSLNHTAVMAMDELCHIKVINRHPLPISDTERQLPRVNRTIQQNSYRDPGTLIYDPPHNTVHLFSCPSKPTILRPIDLWLKPTTAADFLGLSTS